MEIEDITDKQEEEKGDEGLRQRGLGGSGSLKVPKEKVLDLSGDGKLTKVVLKEGEGQVVKDGQFVKIHYSGRLESNNKEFDNSHGLGPLKFCVGARQVILGWDKSVLTMKKGEKAIVTIHPDYGYGSMGIGPIPANSTLVFTMELIDIFDEDPDNPLLSLSSMVIALIVMFLLYYINGVF